MKKWNKKDERNLIHKKNCLVVIFFLNSILFLQLRHVIRKWCKMRKNAGFVDNFWILLNSMSLKINEIQHETFNILSFLTCQIDEYKNCVFFSTFNHLKQQTIIMCQILRFFFIFNKLYILINSVGTHKWIK